MLIADPRLRLEDGLDALVIGGAADEDLLGDGILTKRIQTEVCRTTTTNTVGRCNGNIVGPDTHISIASAELSIIQTLPRILLKVLASVRSQGAVYIGGEGGHPVVDKLEGIPFAQAIRQGEVGGPLEDEVEGGLHGLALPAKVKAVKANISQDGDMMGFLPVVAIFDGVRRIHSGVIGGVLGTFTTTSTAVCNGTALKQEKQDSFQLHLFSDVLCSDCWFCWV